LVGEPVGEGYEGYEDSEDDEGRSSLARPRPTPMAGENSETSNQTHLFTPHLSLPRIVSASEPYTRREECLVIV
jgi:hypothetical protein